MREVLNDVERECIVKHGYGLHSFAQALVDTFERLSVEPVTPQSHEQIHRFAHTIADHAIEILPEVARQAQGVADALSLANASFQVADFKSADVSDGTLIYCYSTCLRAQSRAELADRLAQTQPGTRILTVTHNLEHPALEVKETREMSWEESHRTVYLHVRK